MHLKYIYIIKTVNLVISRSLFPDLFPTFKNLLYFLCSFFIFLVIYQAYSLNSYFPYFRNHMVFSLSEQLHNHGYGWILELDPLDPDDVMSYKTPLAQQLEIDFSDISKKIQYIMAPYAFNKSEVQLVRENPDFWGPLVTVFIFSMISMYSKVTVASWIIAIWFFGSGMVFVLARVLGGDVNYNQVLGVIGYCLIPLIFTGLVANLAVKMELWWLVHFIRLFGVMWASFSSSSLLASIEYKDKKILLAYPIFLLYVYFLHLYTGV